MQRTDRRPCIHCGNGTGTHKVSAKIGGKSFNVYACRATDGKLRLMVGAVEAKQVDALLGELPGLKPTCIRDLVPGQPWVQVGAICRAPYFRVLVGLTWYCNVSMLKCIRAA